MEKENIRIAIDCDDAAIEMKNTLIAHLQTEGMDVVDLQFNAEGEKDYPEIGHNLAIHIQKKKYDRGILLCGTGLGMAIIANKVESVYAGVCHDVFSAERLQKSNNAQVLTMGARVIGSELAKKIVDAWLNSHFNGGRSLSKVEKIRSLEQQSFHPEA